MNYHRSDQQRKLFVVILVGLNMALYTPYGIVAGAVMQWVMVEERIALIAAIIIKAVYTKASGKCRWA